MAARKSLAAICCFLLFMAGCSGGASPPGQSSGLVLYTSHSETVNNAVISRFEQETGIEVSVVPGSTMELLALLEKNSADPEADIFWGGWKELLASREELFTPWDPTGLRSSGDSRVFVPVTREGIVLMVNENWMGSLPCDSYWDLLEPELQGRVAFCDPADSGSSLQALESMVLALGEEAEEYLPALSAQLWEAPGLTSPAAAQACADGEAAACFTSEELAGHYLWAGAPVKLVYPEEGVLLHWGTVQMVRGCSNGESARRFIAFLTDPQTQEFLGTELPCRPALVEGASPWLPRDEELPLLRQQLPGEDPLALWDKALEH
jgi:iron(III) transport system substrate-binding protein